VELGHYFAALGTSVTFVVRSGLVPSEDRDIRAEFERVFKDRHTVYDYTAVESVESATEGVCVTVQHQGATHRLVADQLLVAAGTVPETDHLGLENTDIQCCPKGFIQTDDHARTTVKGVVALGDVRGQYFFRHTANFEGEYVFQRHVAGTQTGPMRYPPVPHAIFTDPQVAGVGLCEPNDASGLIIGVNTYQDSAMGMALRSEHGFVKVLFDRTSLRLVGAHIIGPEAATMIHTCMAFLHMKATLSDMAGLMYIHPALPEVIRNAVRNAVQNKKQAVSA
jgi:dihydrolipoamide dehydrogenase